MSGQNKQETCRRCGNIVPESDTHEVPDTGYWDEVSYEYSEIGWFPRLCTDCYEEVEEELRQRWDNEYKDESNPYRSDNPYGKEA